MISYAQNFEDVMIARIFDAAYRGFYVDVGAGHPDYISVTRHFYDQGWSGINVEPTLRFYPLLCEARPRDINLQCAIGNSPGHATFYEIPKVAENSTLEPDVADLLAASNLAATPHEVGVVRLADICGIHVKDRTIDFMKIDVEGGELGVLQSGDWKRFRPRLLIVEATVVNSKEENWQSWEPILIEAKYHKVWFDGLNNFYLREEDLELRHAFRLPPNIFDGFETAEVAGVKRLAFDREVLGQQIDGLKGVIRGSESDREALRQQIEGLKGVIRGSESDREALRQQIEGLTGVIRGSESGRAALRQQIEALFSRRGFRWLTRFANWPELKKLAELLGKP
jgi:FkbM family methyltransferase